MLTLFLNEPARRSVQSSVDDQWIEISAMNSMKGDAKAITDGVAKAPRQFLCKETPPTVAHARGAAATRNYCRRSLPLVSGNNSNPTTNVRAAPINGYQSPE